MAKGLYLICVVPPRQLRSEIDELRQQFVSNYQPQDIVKQPPHIALYPTVSTDSNFEQSSIQLKELFAGFPSFMIRLKNFNFYNSGRRGALYIDVVHNDTLKSLHVALTRKMLRGFSGLRIEHEFDPHITIGFVDSFSFAMQRVKDEYCKKPFGAVFSVNSVLILKYVLHKWELLHQFPLGASRNIRQNALL